MRQTATLVAITIAAVISFGTYAGAQRIAPTKGSKLTKNSRAVQKTRTESELITKAKLLAKNPYILLFSEKTSAQTQRLSPVQMMQSLRLDNIGIHPVVQQQIADDLNDYVVEWAEPFEGKSEFVLDVIYVGESTWSRYHRIGWCGSIDHGSPCDEGEQVFHSYFRAENKGDDLLDDGDITDYRIVERPLTPQWRRIATYDTLSEAEVAADAIESAAALLDEERVVRIRMIPAS